jgi:hypothetical protein
MAAVSPWAARIPRTQRRTTDQLYQRLIAHIELARGSHG